MQPNSGEHLVLRGRDSLHGWYRFKRVKRYVTSNEKWSLDLFPTNVKFVGRELPVPGGIIYTQCKLCGYDRRVLHRCCREAANLREACFAYNSWWRETYTDQLGRDFLVGVEKNPGPDAKGKDGRRRESAAEKAQHRILSKVKTGFRKGVRGGSLVQRARSAELSQKLGEAEGRAEFLKNRLEELRESHPPEPDELSEDEEEVPTSPGRSYASLGDMTLRAGDERLELQYCNQGLSVPATCTQYAVDCQEGWWATIYGPDGNVDGPVFLNAAMVERYCDRGWGIRTQDSKLSLMSFAADNPYPRPVDSMLTWDPALVVRVLDIICGKGRTDLADYQEEVSSSWPGQNGDLITIYRKDLDIRHRARLLLPVADLPRYVFPINPVELRRAADKRLQSKFNARNWNRAAMKAFRSGSFWMQLHGKGTFQDVAEQEHPVESYARDLAARKGLSTKETEALIRDAMEIDVKVVDPAQHDALIHELEQALRSMKVFIKDESYEKRNTTLRFIVSPPNLVKLLFGCVFRPVEDFLYQDCELLRKHHVKHLNSQAVRDRLMSLSAAKGQKFYETDYSAYEVCQGRECLAAEYGLYESYYRIGSFSRRVLETVEEANTGDTTFLYNKNFRLRVGPMRWSGMPNTACGNLLMNVFNLIYAAGLDPDDQFVCEGDDAMIVAGSDFAKRFEQNSCFAVTCDEASHWSQLSFCGHAYDETGNKRVPPDDVMLARLLIYFTKQPLSLQKSYELLYLRFISFQLLYPNWSGFRDFAERCEMVYRGRVQAKIGSKTYYEWFRGNWWKLTERLRMNPDFRAIPSPVSGRLFPLITTGVLNLPAKADCDDQRLDYDDLLVLTSTAPALKVRPEGPSRIEDKEDVLESWGFSRYTSRLAYLPQLWCSCKRWFKRTMYALATLGLIGYFVFCPAIARVCDFSSETYGAVSAVSAIVAVGLFLVAFGSYFIPVDDDAVLIDPYADERECDPDDMDRHGARLSRAL